MGAARKFKHNYPKEKKNSEKEKKELKLVIEKINKLFESPENHKKAAEIISKLINGKK